MAAEKYLSENYNWFFDEFDITELQDIIQAMEDYSKEQLLLHNVSQRVSKSFYCWESGEAMQDKPLCNVQCNHCRKIDKNVC